MAFPTTYSGWITYVRDWLATDEYSDAQIGQFLDLGQVRLNREMHSYGMEALFPITIADANPVPIIGAIADFNKIRLVSPANTGPLNVAAINEMEGYRKGGQVPAPNSKGFYTIDAGLLYMFPMPAVGEIVDIFYYREIPALNRSPLVDSNVFSTKYPDCLLYAALVEASPYVLDNENLQIWENKYLDALSMANDISVRIKMGSTPLVREIPRSA